MRIITENLDAIAELAAKNAVECLRDAISSNGWATWVIAGGTSPMAAYRILARDYVDALEWSKVQFIIGDERIVPFDHPDSNWTQVEEAFLQLLTPSISSFGRPATASSAEDAADRYETALRGLPQVVQGVPRLDCVWLGVGEDGHTLSLFPGHPSLNPTGRLVIPVHHSPKPPADRISLTLKALRGATKCLILAGGASKASVVAKALDGDLSLPIALVAHEIEQAGGEVTWLLDKASAGTL
jgi:6-phosphogluconolactonase